MFLCFSLDELLNINAIKQKPTKTPSISANHSSSQSSSLAGEIVDVKVEITPPNDLEMVTSLFTNSYSLDANSNSSHNLCLANLAKPLSTRKLSEIPAEGLLNPVNFNRLAAASLTSDQLAEDREIDLSLPYNHYRCLSPSESNLTKCTNEGKYIYAMYRTDSRPGSSRLLRRQFSLDRDDCTSNQVHRPNLDVPPLTFQEHRASPTNLKPSPGGRLHKQCSTSVAVDLEKIEEIPLSPTSIILSNNTNNKYSNDAAEQSNKGKGNSDVVIDRAEISLNIDSLISR